MCLSVHTLNMCCVFSDTGQKGVGGGMKCGPISAVVLRVRRYFCPFLLAGVGGVQMVGFRGHSNRNWKLEFQREREGKTETERYSPSLIHPRKGPPGCRMPSASHVSSQGPSTHTIFCSLLGLISRKLDGKWKSKVSNWPSQTGCRCPKVQLNCGTTMLVLSECFL